MMWRRRVRVHTARTPQGLNRSHLAHIGGTEIGAPCNLPILDADGQPVAYCGVIVRDWPRQPGPAQWTDENGSPVYHPKPHRMEWT